MALAAYRGVLAGIPSLTDVKYPFRWSLRIRFSASLRTGSKISNSGCALCTFKLRQYKADPLAVWKSFTRTRASTVHSFRSRLLTPGPERLLPCSQAGQEG
jgi:hypothetical protein